MRYGRNTCVLYTAPVTSKFSRYANSPFKFYDKACTVSAPSTTSRTSSPGRTSTSLRASTTRPAGTTSRTTAASSTRTGGASTSSRTTATTSVTVGNTSTTSRATATTLAQGGAGTTSTTTLRGASATTSGAGAGSPVERTFQEVVIAFDIPNNRGKRQSSGSSSSTSYFSKTMSLSGANAGYRELTTDATNALKISLTIPPGSSGQVNKLELLAENQVNFADLTALALIANLASGDPWATGGQFLLGASLPGVGRETALSSSPYSNSLRRQYISNAQSNNGAYVAQSPFWTLNLATNEIGAAVYNADGSSTPLAMYYDAGLIKFATSLPAGATALKPKALLNDANVVTKTETLTTQGPTATSTSTSSTILAVPTCNSAVIGRPFTIGADTIVTLPGTSDGAEQIRDGVPAILFERQVIFSHNTKDLSGQTHNPAVFTLDSQCRLVSSESGQYATTGGTSGDQVTLANSGSVTCYCDITTSLNCACGNNPTLGMDGINRLVVRSSGQQTTGKSANFRANFLDQQNTGTTTASMSSTVSTSSTASMISTASATAPPSATRTCDSAITGKPFTIGVDTIALLPGTQDYGDVSDGSPGVPFMSQLVFTNLKKNQMTGGTLIPGVFTLDSVCRLVFSSSGMYATTSDAPGATINFNSNSDAFGICICDITTSLSCDCGARPVLGLSATNALVALKAGQQTDGKTAVFRAKFQDPGPVVAAPTCNTAVINRPFTITADTIVVPAARQDYAENLVNGAVGVLYPRLNVQFTNMATDTTTGKANTPVVFTLDSQCRLVDYAKGTWAVAPKFGGELYFQSYGDIVCRCDITDSLRCACGDFAGLQMDFINRLAMGMATDNSKAANFRANFVDPATLASATTSAPTTTSKAATASPTCASEAVNRPFTIKNYKGTPSSDDFGGWYGAGFLGPIIFTENGNYGNDTQFRLDDDCRLQIVKTGNPFAPSAGFRAAERNGAVIFSGIRESLDTDVPCFCDLADSKLSCACGSYTVLTLDSLSQMAMFDVNNTSGLKYDESKGAFRVEYLDTVIQTSTTSATTTTSMTATVAAATASSTAGACGYYLEAGDNGGVYYAYCGAQIEALETPGQLKHADSFHNCVSICNRDSSCKGINFDKQSTTNNCQLFFALTYTRTESSRYDSAIFGVYVQDTTTTTVMSATTTSSATAAATCSAPVITSDNGKTFDAGCGVDFVLDDGMPNIYLDAKSFTQCVNICASRSDCLAILYDTEKVAFGQCHIYTVYSNGRKNPNPRYDSAALRTTSTTASITTTTTIDNPAFDGDLLF
ncbi:hypothetical protein TI39_contig478g00001 [Zymoseptoria brevis]|uniref:Apple domain-containing protein n=1 Tax=Zymoseptoria brevis TaxID=1047168 RepID=A0A0F4GJJ0_9PEZI|nr:hypothetical protein TI39_contig478g00001 [Zymoseptoria brevis]